MASDPARMVALFRQQAGFCAGMGSPMYGVLLDLVATDIERGGPTVAVLEGHEDDPGPSALALRLMGAVHRLVLERRAPELATFYPSVGGSGDPSAAWPALAAVLAAHREEIRALLHRPPQTNEVGRSAALAGGLAHVLAWRAAPVRLVEIGASGGLNLRVDRFRIQPASGPGVGPVDSPLVMPEAWTGRLPLVGPALRVVERLGCDRDPVDPTTTEGRVTLTSYVWPDQGDRLARLRAALEVARQTPAQVVAQDAGPFVRGLRLEPGTTTVLWHSIMWQYLTPAERAEVDADLEALGETTDATTGLARVSLEPMRRRAGAEHEFVVRLRTWPGDGTVQELGTAPPHGLPVHWE